jgi:hypothetical protein
MKTAELISHAIFRTLEIKKPAKIVRKTLKRLHLKGDIIIDGKKVKLSELVIGKEDVESQIRENAYLAYCKKIINIFLQC